MNNLKRVAALAALILVAALVGCSSGTDQDSTDLDVLTNRRGPWPAKFWVEGSYPNNPEGAPYEIVVTVYDGEKVEEVFDDFIGQAGDRFNTPLTVWVRPGTYLVVGVMTDASGKLVRSQPMSLTMLKNSEVDGRPVLEMGR